MYKTNIPYTKLLYELCLQDEINFNTHLQCRGSVMLFLETPKSNILVTEIN